MDKAQFQTIISSNNWHSPANLELLREASTQQPYFQVAELMYLAGLKLANSSDFDEELKRAAFLIPDRRFLFSFLKDQNSPVEKSEVAVEIQAEDPVSVESGNEFVLLDADQNTNVEVDSVAATLENDDILELIADSQFHETDSNIDGLIDKFLNNIPNIQRQNKAPLPGEEVVLEDISLDSIVEPEEVATESLAEIYIQQQYFDKAIEVYKKLCLKYPEKSSYFAVQIEKINQGLNH